MALTRFEPFREMVSMQRQMNRLLDQMMSIPGDPESFNSAIAFMPAAEINETEDTVKLRMELPGIEARDLDVKVTANAVAIVGERKQEINQEEKGIRHSEFRYGSFQRVIPLPVRVQNDQVKAEFQNGILCLTLPKAEEEKKRVVTISLNGEAQGQRGQQLQPSSQRKQTQSSATPPQHPQ